MKQIAQIFVERNYKKRILAILIAAAVLFLTLVVLIPTTLHRQISELHTLENAREEQEQNFSDNLPETPEVRRRDSKEHEIKSILRQLTPIETGVKIVLAALAVLAFLLGVFYWITVAEWLYKMAVLHELNRALWPMLGLLFNVLTLPALLVVLCDPRRVGKRAQQ